MPHRFAVTFLLSGGTILKATQSQMSHGCPIGWTGSFVERRFRASCDRRGQDCPQFIDIAEGERQDLPGLFDDPDQLVGMVFLNPVNAHDIGMHGVFLDGRRDWRQRVHSGGTPVTDESRMEVGTGLGGIPGKQPRAIGRTRT